MNLFFLGQYDDISDDPYVNERHFFKGILLRHIKDV